MRLVFTIILFLNCIIISAQNTTTVVVSGIGKTYIEAEHFAIRSALEQSCGVFLSSKTKVLNDILLNDEIFTITNGNILEYTVLDKHKITDKSFTVTLEVIISLDRLTEYVKANGTQVEYKGSNIYHEIKQIELNKKAELAAIENILPVINNNIYDYEINSSMPTSLDKSMQKWKIRFDITVNPNSNFKKNTDMLEGLLENISIKSQELTKMQEMGIEIYTINYGYYKGKDFYLRNESSYKLLHKIYNQFNYNILNFEISTNKKPLEIGELRFDKKIKETYYHQFTTGNSARTGHINLNRTDKQYSFQFYIYNNNYYKFNLSKLNVEKQGHYPYTILWMASHFISLEYIFNLNELSNIDILKIKPIITKNIIEKENGNINYYTQRDLESELKNEGYLSSDISKIISGIDKSNFKPQEKNIDHSNYDIDTILAKQFNSILNSLIYNKIEKKNFPFTQINSVNNINTLTKDKELNPEYDYENNFDYNIYDYFILSAENSYVKILFDTTKTQLFNSILSSQNDYNIIKITREKQWMTPVKIPFFTTQESADAGILDYTYFQPSLKETEFIKVHFSDNKSIKIFDAEKYLMDYIDYFISYYKIVKVGNDDDIDYVINDNRYSEKQKAGVLYWLYLLKQTASGYENMFIISEKY